MPIHLLSIGHSAPLQDPSTHDWLPCLVASTMQAQLLMLIMIASRHMVTAIRTLCARNGFMGTPAPIHPECEVRALLGVPENVVEAVL